MALIAKALKPGGLLAFTVEELDDDSGSVTALSEYFLLPVGRFGHAKRCVCFQYRCKYKDARVCVYAYA